MQDFINVFWSQVVDSGVLENPMLEAYVAAGSFFVWISLYTLISYTPLKRYQFQNASPSPPIRMQTWISLPIYLLSIQILHSFFFTKRKSSDENENPNIYRLIIEVGFGIWFYDLIFWVLHITMHIYPIIFKNMHSIHHSVYCNPAGTVYHSFFDGLTQVAVNIFVQQISPCDGYGQKHTLSRLLHNVIVTYMLVEIHSEYDAWWSMHNIAPKIFGGALRHRYHHAYSNPNFSGRKGVHYHQFFKYLDDFFDYKVSDEECRNAQFATESVIKVKF